MTQAGVLAFLQIQAEIRQAAWELLPRFLQENGVRWASGHYDTLSEITEEGVEFTGYDGCDPTRVTMPLRYLWDEAFRLAEIARRAAEEQSRQRAAAAAAAKQQAENEARERRQYERLKEKYG